MIMHSALLVYILQYIIENAK